MKPRVRIRSRAVHKSRVRRGLLKTDLALPAIAVLLAVLGCAVKDEPGRFHGIDCMPGTTEACACEDGTTSTQVCLADGKGISACLCDRGECSLFPECDGCRECYETCICQTSGDANGCAQACANQ